MAELVSESEIGLYGAACRCDRSVLQCGRRRGVAGCHHLPPPYLPGSSVSPPPDTPQRVPFRSRGFRNSSYSTDPKDSTEVSLLWHFTARRPTRVALVRTGLPKRASGPWQRSHPPTPGLRWGRTLLTRSTRSGRDSGHWKPAAPAPQAQLPIPPGTRSSALSGRP